MRLLLIEDNELNVELFVETLETDGHAVTVERDGARGGQRALAERFDIILLDVQLPTVNGLEVCRLLRAAGVRAPILGVSSDAMPEQIARAREAGFDEYITKPITPTALRAAVRRHAGRPAGS